MSEELLNIWVECAWRKCNEKFQKLSHNQKFHDPKCRQDSGNEVLISKYHEKKANRKGADRRCVNCDIKLSRYNDNSICGPCEKSKKLINLKNLFI